MEYFDFVEAKIQELKSEEAAIQKAGKLMSQVIRQKGVIHIFGSGHSYMLAMEIALRAGSLAPFISINEPSLGQYERIAGVGKEFMRKMELRENDCFILVSNSGRNPLPLEMALEIKKRKLPLIVLTSLDVSKEMESRDKSGKKLYEFADIILDNKGVKGDAAIEVGKGNEKVAATSTVLGCMLLNQAVVECCKYLAAEGIELPILRSANVDGGKEYNDQLLGQYYDRYRVNIVL